LIRAKWRGAPTHRAPTESSRRPALIGELSRLKPAYFSIYLHIKRKTPENRAYFISIIKIKGTMKVSIEIPKSAIKKAAYLFMSQMKDEEDEEKVNKAVEALEKEDSITISDELFNDQADQIYLVFALSALATKAKELEDPLHWCGA
jgi:hypothetical protein